MCHALCYQCFQILAWVGVSILLDLREGISSEICFTTNYGDVNQILDYKGVPFH